MGKKIVSLVIAVSVFGVLTSPVQAATKEGAKCSVAGKTVTVAGRKLVCAKVAKTLKWIAVSAPATTVAPSTTAASTTTVASTTTTTVAPTTTTSTTRTTTMTQP